MQNIHKSQLELAFQAFLAQDVYLHSEATSYLFVRNFKVRLEEAFVAGDGPFRVALRFDGLGWLRMEALTHVEETLEGQLLLAGYDELGRMNVALHLGKEPFPE